MHGKPNKWPFRSTKPNDEKAQPRKPQVDFLWQFPVNSQFPFLCFPLLLLLLLMRLPLPLPLPASVLEQSSFRRGLGYKAFQLAELLAGGFSKLRLSTDCLD